MKWQDQLSVNVWEIYSNIRCKLFELQNKRGKVRTISDIEVNINGVLNNIDPKKIKFQDGFTSYPSANNYNLKCDHRENYQSGPNIGVWDKKNVIWDKNSSVQFLVTNENGVSSSWNGGTFHYDYKAGYMDTHNKVTIDKGWFHGKFKLTHNNYFWPAWWLLGDRVINGDGGITPEFDILEEIDGRLTFTASFDYSGEHLKYSPNSIKMNTSQWFIMSFHWTEKFLEWYVNGFLVKKFSLNNTCYVPKPHWMLFNEAYKGEPNFLTGKDGMKIDWILVTDPDVDFKF